MSEFSFSALGTTWNILTDGEAVSEEDKAAVLGEVSRFESRFSRFLHESETNRFREAKPGTYVVSETFSSLLRTAEKLRILTDGAYDPAIGGLLEHAGYDPSYRFSPDAALEGYHIPAWSLSGDAVTIDGSVVFDFGGIGKGYCIDLVSDQLARLGYGQTLVDGGGDMRGTRKRDGSPFRVALEWPGRPDTAFGIVDVAEKAVAVSDRFRRRFGTWHHIVDPRINKPVDDVVGCAALAPTAFAADCATSALFLAPSETYGDISKEFQAEFVVFRQDGTTTVSQNWPGELF